MSRWFRHYAGMMRDEKLVSAAMRSKQPVERVVWVWGAILESAAEVNDGGRYDFDADEAAYFLRCDGSDISSIVAALEALGRLSQGIVVRWGDRQFESDKSTDRVRKFREKRDVSQIHERGNVAGDNCNADETGGKRSVTPPETETETESLSSESDSRRALAEKILVDKKFVLDDWEDGFLSNVAGRKRLTKAQNEQWQSIKTRYEAKPETTGPPINSGVYVHYGTDPGDAWERHYRTKGKVPPRDFKGGWYFPSEYPQEAA